MKINTITRSLQSDLVQRVIAVCFCLLLIPQFVCNAQDLYGHAQSEQYAGYLFSSKQHVLAAEEYERLIYFDDSNLSYKINLIKSYRLAGNMQTGINRIYTLYGKDLAALPQELSSEYIKMEILSDSLAVAEKFADTGNQLSPETVAVFESLDLLLIGNYKEAVSFARSAAIESDTYPESVLLLSEKAGLVKFKSPFIAGSLSAIVPGTGKFYTKNLTDGLFSLLFVASNAWQAYRGFNEKGAKSIYGWTFAGLSASFYIGNVFGAVKSAKRYNTLKKNEIDNQVFEFIRSDNF